MTKQTYSPSRIKHYFRCPKSFALSRKHDAAIGAGTQSAMREGLLFEGYLFGFKDDKDEKELIGRKKAATLEGIQAHASYCKAIFNDGEAYRKLHHDNGSYIMRGEIDYVGSINPESIKAITGHTIPFERAIIDVKYTGDISRSWGTRSKREDFLQAVHYTYCWYKETGEVLPFMYILVESSYTVPIVKCVEVKYTPDDWDWLTRIIDHIDNDIFMEASASEEVCFGGRGQSRCWYMDHCSEGRDVAGGFRFVDFSELISEL